MIKTIEFTKIREVKSPSRANKHDAGIDFYIPELSDNFYNDLIEKNKHNNVSYKIDIDSAGGEILYMYIAPHSQINIPSGIKVNIIDKNTYLEAQNKSGVATKYRLVVGAAVVDADYQGEIHLNLINTSDEEVILFAGQKIVQFIHKEYIDTDFLEISNEEYDMIDKSDRGTGGFGSSGKK